MTRRHRIDLSFLDEAFAEAHAPTPEPLPDGLYTVEVEAVELRQTRASARPMLCWTLRVLAPRAAVGRRLWRNQVLGVESLGWLKKDLRLCGLDLTRLSDLPDHIHELCGTTMEIAKRTRGDYQSITFRRRTPAP